MPDIIIENQKDYKEAICPQCKKPLDVLGAKVRLLNQAFHFLVVNCAYCGHIIHTGIVGIQQPQIVAAGPNNPFTKN